MMSQGMTASTTLSRTDNESDEQSRENLPVYIMIQNVDTDC